MMYNGKCGYVGGINDTYDMSLHNKDSEFNRILRVSNKINVFIFI